MKILLWSIGKNHESYVSEGILQFTKRIAHYYPVEWKIFATAKNAAKLSNADVKKAEATAVLQALQRDDVLIALDENGKLWNSPQVAELISKQSVAATKNLVFLIGGAYGLDATLLERAQHQWSLSKLVFPHQLVRLMLAEQIYRACTIIRNEKYHHT